MKVDIITSSEKFSDKHDYRQFMHIKINDQKIAEFLDGEPEDANLSRDFSDVFNITEMIRMAHSAGKKGEELIINEKESDNFV